MAAPGATAAVVAVAVVAVAVSATKRGAETRVSGAMETGGHPHPSSDLGFAVCRSRVVPYGSRVRTSPHCTPETLCSRLTVKVPAHGLGMALFGPPPTSCRGRPGWKGGGGGSEARRGRGRIFLRAGRAEGRSPVLRSLRETGGR